MSLAAPSIVIPYRPRVPQREYHDARARFRVLVAHRRMGKTIGVVNDLVRDVLRADTFMPMGAYVAPLRNQAKRIAWPFLMHYTKDIPGRYTDKSELMVGFPGDRRIYCLGSDNPDAIRGSGLDAVVIDETAQIDPVCWGQVIRPALADREGRATFIGTPKGRLNLFHRLWEESAQLEGWWRKMYKASETGLIPDKELAALKREMNDPNEYLQEFECSFNAAVVGSYYGKEMAALDERGRLSVAEYDKRLPVLVSLDLGWSDLMIAWFCQVQGNQVRVIDCRAYQHSSITDMVLHWRSELPWPVAIAIVPHDIAVSDLGTGTTRRETLWAMNVKNVICPRHTKEDGRDAVRDLLPRCVFDKQACLVGIEGLVQYRTEYDSVLRVYRRTEVKDWATHYADSFRYLAVGLPIALGILEDDEDQRRSRPGRKKGGSGII